MRGGADRASLCPLLVGKTLQKSNIRQELGIIILGIKSRAGAVQFNPPSDATLAEATC